MRTFACRFIHKWSRWTPIYLGGRLRNHRWCQRCRDVEIKDILA